jgi:hypothetical protein
MKKIFVLFLTGIVGFSMSSCKKYLDVNSNPNQAISGTPELVLPQAMTSVANLTWGTSPGGTGALGSSYNFYGSQVAGYLANGGGVSGWGAIISYNYAATDQQGLWNVSYDVATDIQYVIDNTEGKPEYAQFNAAAKVLKAYTFQRLVDQYGDLPYSQALKGAENVTPAYDKATDIYKALADLLDESVTIFKANPTASTAFRAADVMLASGSSNAAEITRWIQFANTLKLRLILRAGDKVAFTNKTFDAAGFLTEDALVNPGYGKVSGKQNPGWNNFTYNFAGAAVGAGAQYVPTPFIMGFYDGKKLTDPARADVTYTKGTTTATNQLGNQLATAGRGISPNSWFKGDGKAGTVDNIGIFKGPSAPQPVILAADSYFLQAEGVLKGLIAGNVQTNFDLGIQQSYKYLYKNSTGTVTSGKQEVVDAKAYQAANATSYLANIQLATTAEQQLEAIITQKYIALNMIFGDEAWNEYRRTGYPRNNAAVGASPVETIISVATESTAPDKLPTRLLYPSTEFTYNAANVPGNIDKYSTKIFWAK